ncbi:MAG: tetratricopeptide repeat protein [Fidelibacterota bacterium]
MRPGKTILFRFILALIPILILVGMEFSLRVLHFGSPLALFQSYPENEDYYIANPEVALRYFSIPGQTGLGGDDAFKKKKTPQTLRIFVLGGSTTAGFPYFFNGRFSVTLQNQLSLAYPGWDIEVINLGMTAVNSYTVRDFARECLPYDPDLILIYAGHNEFYGALGSASSQHSLFGTNRTLTLLYLKLKRLRLYQLLQTLLHKLQPQQPIPDSRTLMARMAQNQAIPYHSTLYNKTLSIFQQNLQDIIHWTQQQNIPLLLGTLVSNLKDQPPFVSLHDPQVKPQTVDSLLNQIKPDIDQQHYQPALNQLQKLLTYDSTYAQTYFLAGRCSAALQQVKTAREYYRKARDYDALRFRAPSDLNDLIHELAKQNLVYLTDIDSTFSVYSPNGIVGNNLILEHLHPNLEGYFLMGKAFAQTILRQQLLHIKHPNLPAPLPLPPDSLLKNQIAVTNLDKQIAQYQMEILLSDWPFKTGENAKTYASLQPKSRLERIALETLRKRRNFWEAHLELANYYQQNKRYSEAIQEGKALLQAFPYLWKSRRVLGRLYVYQNKYEKALPLLLSVLQERQDAFSAKWVGAIYLQRGQQKEAIPYLQSAVEWNPQDHQARYNLSGAYYLTGEREKAINELKTLLEKAPNFPNAKQFLEQLEALKQ